MRCSIVGATMEQVKSAGATGIKEARLTGIIFAELTGEQVVRLKSMGAVVKVVEQTRLGVLPPPPVVAAPLYTLAQVYQITEIDKLRYLTTPPLLGSGANIAVLDTGIRETHDLIGGRVVYRRNFTSDPDGDGFDHGTGVASVVVVVAPHCNLLDLKVLDDSGRGTEEDVVMAVDHCIELHDMKPEIAPSTINMSLGGPDTGDPNEPLRVAARAAIKRGIWLACAAGNQGPEDGTIMSPATERDARAVGSVSVEPFRISSFSSRGPTKEGLIKPDVVGFGENIILASSRSDSAVSAKSGTSFATPFIAGLNALLHEGMYRYVVVSPDLQEAYPTISDALREWMDPATFEPLLPYLTTKPQGEPTGKDNYYGYGMPLGTLVARAMTQGAATNVSSIVAPIMTIGILGMMMGAMAKALK